MNEQLSLVAPAPKPAPRSHLAADGADAARIMATEPVPAFRYIGKCKGCGHVYVQEIVTRWVETRDSYGQVWVRRQSAGTERHVFCSCNPAAGRGRGSRVALRLVKGSYSESHVCDARCLNAVGPSCECSCGGANHGAGHIPDTA
jgi:hypothetical protein